MAKEDVEKYRQISKQIDELFSSGKAEEGAKLLEEAIAMTKDISPAYHFFFLAEQANYIEKNHKIAEEIINKAINLRAKDYFLLRNLGLYLSWQDKDEEAILIFNEVLKIAPKDYNTLRNLGVSLSKLNLDKKAIKLYNAALKINPKDYDSLRQKGVSLAKLEKYKLAIPLFEKALTIVKNDGLLHCYLAAALFLLHKEKEAFKKINLAKQLLPTNTIVDGWYRYITARVSPKELDKAETAEQEIKDIIPLVQNVQKALSKRQEEFFAKMRETKKNRDSFLENNSHFKQDQTIFLILRKWNSYTPIIPGQNDERYVGGGYFLFNNGNGTVIDPGYNFIENFYNAGGRVCDINNIILTHAHNDHTNDFESLLSLLYQFNRTNFSDKEKDRYKKVKIYLNNGSFMKFSGLINLRSAGYIDNLYVMSPGQTFDLGEKTTLTVIPANHDETISEKYSLGIKLIFNDNDLGRRNILITSDTGLFPQTTKEIKDKRETVADVKGREVWEDYGLNDKDPINLLITHIGSIKEKELTTNPNDKLEEVFYLNHLGIIGTIRVITKVKPKLAVLSEFGEELSDIQEDLTNIVAKVVTQILNKQTDCKVLPGDLTFIYNVWNETIYCVLTESMLPYSKIVHTSAQKGKAGKAQSTFFYRKAHVKNTEVEKLNSKIHAYYEALNKHKGLYFKD